MLNEHGSPIDRPFNGIIPTSSRMVVLRDAVLLQMLATQADRSAASFSVESEDTTSNIKLLLLIMFAKSLNDTT